MYRSCAIFVTLAVAITQIAFVQANLPPIIIDDLPASYNDTTPASNNQQPLLNYNNYEDCLCIPPSSANTTSYVPLPQSQSETIAAAAVQPPVKESEHADNSIKQANSAIQDTIIASTAPLPQNEPTLSGNESKFRYAATKFELYGVVGYMHFTYNGTTTLATINITAGLPRNGTEGYFYHLHQKPVPANGNCTETTGHLDPFHVNPMPGHPYPCDPRNLRTCEVGDLSGKHGLLEPIDPSSRDWLTGAKPITFLDPQLDWSNQPEVSIFYGRSINIHRPSDLVRFSCANLVETNRDWVPLTNFNAQSANSNIASNSSYENSSDYNVSTQKGAIALLVTISVLIFNYIQL